MCKQEVGPTLKIMPIISRSNLVNDLVGSSYVENGATRHLRTLNPLNTVLEAGYPYPVTKLGVGPVVVKRFKKSCMTSRCSTLVPR